MTIGTHNLEYLNPFLVTSEFTLDTVNLSSGQSEIVVAPVIRNPT